MAMRRAEKTPTRNPKRILDICFPFPRAFARKVEFGWRCVYIRSD